MAADRRSRHGNLAAVVRFNGEAAAGPSGAAGYTGSPERGRGTATPSRARSHRLGVRSESGAARPRSRTTSSSPSSPSSGPSTAATSTRRRCCAGCPSSGERVLQGPGENAGVIDLGDGVAVAFKVESHNHPSAVEPFQGAATGRRRDPARHRRDGRAADRAARRPVVRLARLALPPRRRRHRPLRQLRRRPERRRRDRVRRGVRRQPARQRDVRRPAPDRARAAARRRRAPATLSSSTARPPAATASAAHPCSRARISKAPTRSARPSRSATRSAEGADRGLARARRAGPRRSLQDCGAAGLASSLSEMARDGAGVDVHLDRVPLREPDLEPWEIMISESQERMVASSRRSCSTRCARL